jgi:hypothetical protein
MKIPKKKSQNFLRKILDVGNPKTPSPPKVRNSPISTTPALSILVDVVYGWPQSVFVSYGVKLTFLPLLRSKKLFPNQNFVV